MSIKIADAFIEVIMDYAQAEKDAGKMENRIGGLTQGTITKLSAGMVAAGAAITGTLGVATAKAASFGELLANVATLGVKDLAALDVGTRDLAVKFGLDLNDAIQVTYDTLSAGIPENAAIMVMEKAALGAQAGVGSLSEAMDLGTSAMNAWNLKSADANVTTANFEKIMGQAATAVKAGKTTIAEMAQSIGAVAPIMAEAGVSTDEFFAAVSALTATGMPASQAMTSMRGAISNIIKPQKEAQETAEALGLEFDAAALKSQGLAKFLENVREKTGGNVETMGQLFGSVEGLGSMLSLTGVQADNFKNILGEMGNAQDNLNTMAKAFRDNNPAQAFKELKAALQNLFILIGRTVMPALQFIVPVLKNILEHAAAWMEVHPKWAAAIGTTAGVIGILLTALGTLGLVLSPFASIFLAFSTAAGGAGVAAAGAGAAAAGGAVGFGALAATVGTFLLAAVAVGAIVGAAGFSLYKFGELALDTIRAFRDLEESTKRTNAAFEEYESTLIRQGVQLDQAALKEMDHSQRSAAITQATIEHKESAMAREIYALTGVDATRDQIHRAELARVGLQVSAQEAAALAVEGITKEEIQARMKKASAAQETEAAIRETEAATRDQQAADLAAKINLMADAQGLERVGTADVSEFKRLMLSGDLEAAQSYWSNLRQQQAVGLGMSLDQWRAYSDAVQAELAELRQAAAYAMNPAQTGSPSLNQEMAKGFVDTEAIMQHALSRMSGAFVNAREEARMALSNMGARMIGSQGAIPTPRELGATAAVNNSSSTTNGGAVSIDAPIRVEVNGVTSPEAADRVIARLPQEIIRQIRRDLARGAVTAARGRGIRSPGVYRSRKIPTPAS